MRQLKKKEIKQLINKEYKREREIYLILENIQYARNVAGIFRTAESAGVRRIYLTGISQSPPFGKDLQKASRNSEKRVEWLKKESTGEVISQLKKQGFTIIAIELTDKSIHLNDLHEKLIDDPKICFVAGSEVYGVINKTLENCDLGVFIPMYGKGASLNVATSVGIVLFSI
jgi:23S rRNA (guanosine2251-2'-O)-methyltransferase